MAYTLNDETFLRTHLYFLPALPLARACFNLLISCYVLAVPVETDSASGVGGWNPMVGTCMVCGRLCGGPWEEEVVAPPNAGVLWKS